MTDTITVDTMYFAQALRERDRLAARVEELERQRHQRDDCGQDGVCAIAPGCDRHWLELNGELIEERDAIKVRVEELEGEIELVGGEWKLCLERTNRELRELLTKEKEALALYSKQWAIYLKGVGAIPESEAD